MINILFISAVIIFIGLGTLYQIKSYNKQRELHSLQMKNEAKRSQLLDLQIKEGKAKQHLYENAIKQMKEEDKDVQ